MAIQGFDTSVTTDTQGNYAGSILASKNITITPQLQDYTFTPQKIELNNVSQDYTKQDFTGTYQKQYTIAGKVTDHAGKPLAGLQLKGLAQPTQTNAQGNYSFKVNAGNNLSFWAELQDYTFIPQKIELNNVSQNHIGQDFKGTYQGQYTIAGKVIDHAGKPLAGVQLKGLAQQIQTDAQENYSFKVTAGSNLSFWAELQDYTFTPQRIELNNVSQNHTGQDFTGTYQGQYTIAGKVIDHAGKPLVGVSLFGLTQTVITDVQGSYSI